MAEHGHVDALVYYNGKMRAKGTAIDPFAEDAEGRTPLLVAVFCKNLDIVKKLLEIYGHPNAGGTRWGRPLHWAAVRGHTEIVEALFRAGGKTEHVTDPIIAQETFADVARAGHADVLRLMHKFDPESPYRGYKKPLIVDALEYGHSDAVISCFVDLGIAQSHNLGRPLDFILKSYQSDIVGALKQVRRLFEILADVPMEIWIGPHLRTSKTTKWGGKNLPVTTPEFVDFLDNALLPTLLDCGLSPFYPHDEYHDLPGKALSAWLESGVVKVS
jgi:hypothetical protein